MRRLLLLALIVPGLAAAQTPPVPTAGNITFATVNLSETDQFIDLAECVSSTATIKLSWSPSYSSSTVTSPGFANVKSYWLYASNKATTGDCPTTNGDKGDTTLIAGLVDPALKKSELSNPPLTDPMTWDFSTADIAVSGLGTTACSLTSDTTIYLCVQARDSETANGNNIGTARGTLVLSTALPPAPTGVGALPGDQAANVSWSKGSVGSGQVDSTSYVIEATPIGATGASFRSSPRITTTTYRLTGLTNDVGYQIRVRAFSAASNPSLLSDPAFVVTPSHVLDFFAMYEAAGGQERGGCSGGPAGPLALLAGAVALLAVRRKKK